MKKIKLLYITNGIAGAGGLERVLSIKASYLAEKYNYEVHILVLNEDKSLVFYEFSPEIIIHNVNTRQNPILFFKNYYSGIKNIIKKVSPDIISVCDDGIKGFLFPIIFSKSSALIYERHASLNLNFIGYKGNFTGRLKRRFLHFVMNSAGKRFNAFVVLTKGNLKEWKTGNEIVIPNPLSFNCLHFSELNQKKVIAVGSHSFNKGFDLLLDSWKKVIAKNPDWRLEIYGKKDVDSTYLKLAQKLKIESSVLFFDPVKNIKEKYLSSSIFVLPSRSEGFGMVLIEAMACGLPCVSFDCPHGPADIVTNGEDGFLVENENITQLAEHILKFIENEQLRKKMGENARENVKRYLPENIVQQWDVLFKKLITRNNA